MEPDKKRKFNFGTGEIDVDQWLRDIDAGLPEYYNSVGRAYHNTESEEIRNAMTDLIGRISSGDMVSRSANGTYNFKSQLYSPNRGKYTKWAYQTALNYIGGKGRGLITPVKTEEAAKEEPKKNIYSTQELIKRFNNSVQRGSTRLDLDTTWWGTADANKRAEHLSKFLNNEANYVRSTDDVDEAYKDIGKEGLASAMTALAQSILSNPNGDYGQEFGNLGITNLLRRSANPSQQQQPKTVDEQLQAAQNAELDRRKRIQLGWLNNKGQDTYYNNNSNFYKSSIQGLDAVHANRRSGADVQAITAERRKNNPQDMPGMIIDDAASAALNYKHHFSDNVQKVRNFLPILQNNWESLFTNGELSYDDGNGNMLQMTPQQLWENLALLTHQMPDKNGQMGYTYVDNSRNYPISVGDQLYYIPGTYRSSGDILLLDTYDNRLVKSSIANYSKLQDALGEEVLYKKEGGILKLAGGGQTDDNYSRFGVEVEPVESQSYDLTTTQPTTQKPASYEWTAADYARIGGAAADIISALSANVPVYGTAVSAVTGIGSTLANTAADWSQDGWRAGLKTALFGLGTDALGLIPGWGMSAKFGKIAKGLSRYAKYLGPALAAGGFGQAAAIANKGFTQGWDNVTPDEWSTFAQGLSGMAKGTAGVKRANRANLERAAVTHHKIRTQNGTNIVTSDELKKLKDNGTRIYRSRPVVTQEGLFNAQEEILKQTRFKPFSTVSDNRFEKMLDFKGVPSKRKEFINFDSPEEIPGYIPTATRESIGVRNPFNKDAALERLKQLRQKKAKPTIESQPPVEEVKQPPKPEVKPEPEVETPKPEIKPEVKSETSKPKQNDKKKNRGKKSKKHELGGYFTFLRTGGVIKYELGGSTGVRPGKNYNWQTNVFDHYKNHILEGLGGPNADSYMEWLNSMQGKHAQIYQQAGGDKNIWQSIAYKGDDVKNYQTDYQKGFEGVDTNNPYNMSGISSAYSADQHYDFSDSKNRATKETTSITGNNGSLQAIPDGLFSQITDDRRLLGRAGDWDSNSLQEFAKQLNQLGFDINLGSDNYYRISKLDNSKQNPTGNENDPKAEKVESSEIEGKGLPDIKPELKQPYDPRALYIGARAFSTIGLNNWMYDNMQVAPPAFKDFTDKRLDTIGDYSALAFAGNHAADLRRIQQLRNVSDQSLNLAADYETGRINTEGDVKAKLQDDARQATTHEAALQVDLKDVDDRREVSWFNRLALKDYLQQLADIRNARNKAMVDATIGAVNNLTQLGTSKYIEKKAAYNQARSVMLQQPLERAQERMKLEHPDLYSKIYNNQDVTESDIAMYNQLLSKYVNEAKQQYASDFYALYGGKSRWPRKMHGVEDKDLQKARKGAKLSFIKSLRT